MVSKEDLVHFLKEDKYRHDRITREEMLKKKHGRYLDLEVREVTENKAKIELTGEGRPTAASLLIKDWIKSKFE
ncbi:hypothetical protein AKJ41_04900, partial [candidate division MSBL1 archaeon SCGC-AAA259O05]